MNELIIKYNVATCHYKELCHVIAYSSLSPINYNIKFTGSQQVRELCPFDLNWYWILYRWNISMGISDMSTS